MTNWSEAIAARVAAAVKRAREAEQPKLSVAKLADRTAELGHPMSRSVISDLELGRKRSLDVAELLVLAAALKIPPAALLYPDLPDGPVEVLPERKVTSFDAVQWFSGEEYLEGAGEEAYKPREPLALSRARKQLRSMIESVAAAALSDIAMLRDNPELSRALAGERETLAQLEQRMRELGLPVDDEAGR